MGSEESKGKMTEKKMLFLFTMYNFKEKLLTINFQIFFSRFLDLPMTVMGLGYLTSATAKIPIRSFTFFIFFSKFFIFFQIFFKFLFLNVGSPKEMAMKIIM